jgi:hypothetical protein
MEISVWIDGNLQGGTNISRVLGLPLQLGFTYLLHEAQSFLRS